ncbi:hypothetical protein [Aquimarina sp. RZ0]|uniref:DUF7660 family protein n=1 Tax=Aquimarina sp. RZ0 TaxID=2607730 RepID=UPI0011F111A6|nr:hypothetical protein [Aquimarina sp. RZ0]KAA1244548.1 hypothetical protein F0000_16310 [Aquimarina sp. RZ0]
MTNIYSRKEFINFLKVILDEYQKHPERWENHKMEDFLEAMIRYSDDVQQYYKNTNQEINADEAQWKVFADIIKGASIYE